MTEITTKPPVTRRAKATISQALARVDEDHETNRSATAGPRPAPGAIDVQREIRNGRRDFANLDLVGLYLPSGLSIPPDCTFRGSNLSRACLRGVSAAGVDFGSTRAQDADFRGLDLSLATLDLCDWSHVHLTGALLHGARCLGAKFTRARMSGADFDGADLSRANFQNSVISGASFRNSSIDRADFRGAIFDGRTRLQIARATAISPRGGRTEVTATRDRAGLVWLTCDDYQGPALTTPCWLDAAAKYLVTVLRPSNLGG